MQSRLLVFCTLLSAVCAGLTENKLWYTTVNAADPYGHQFAQWRIYTLPTTQWTFSDINANVDETNLPVNITVSVGGANGLTNATGYATLTGMRGDRYTVQKSYKITLDVAWNQRTTFRLMKEAFDLSRARTVLADDLILNSPNMIGQAHQFVRLYIDNADAGVFVALEQPGNEWLANHGFSGDALLYGAEAFWFQPVKGLVAADDPAYNQTLFDKVLDTYSTYSDNHHRLLAMVADVANPALDTATVIARHFDLNNLLTFMANSLLVNNLDVATSGYMLYSPVTQANGAVTWYLAPRDARATFGFYTQAYQALLTPTMPRWLRGAAAMWQNTLFSRVLQTPAYVATIVGTTRVLYESYFNENVTQSFLNEFKTALLTNLATSPDIWLMPTASADLTSIKADISAQFDLIPRAMASQYADIVPSMHLPRPPWTSYSFTTTTINLVWDPAFHILGCRVVSEVEFTADAEYQQLLYAARDIEASSITVDLSLFTPNTTVFYRVIQRDASNPTVNWVQSFGDTVYLSNDMLGTTVYLRDVNNLTVPEHNATSPLATASTATITASAAINGLAYAVLDGTSPYDAVKGCQGDQYYTIPDGWHLAPDNKFTRRDLAALNLQFGADCVVLANGWSLMSKSGKCCVNPNKVGVLPQLQTVMLANGLAVKPRWCRTRVLLVNDTQLHAADTCSTANVVTNPGATGVFDATAVQFIPSTSTSLGPRSVSPANAAYSVDRATHEANMHMMREAMMASMMQS